MALSAPSIASLHLYPIKSCRGHAAQEVALDCFGPVGDRRFLIVDDQGRFLTQRTLSRLALVVPHFEENRMTLHAPDMSPLEISVTPAPDALECDVVIWRDTVRATELDPQAARWLSQFLGTPARLVAIAPTFSRPIRKDTARPGDETAFADAFPLLVISEASLADLNGRLDQPLPMDRFRPNIVLRGCAPYAEDTWKRIRIGDVVLRAGGPCGRCIVTTTDQRTLERAKEPLRTLALYRRSADGDVLFGQNYIHETKGGSLRVGAPVEILE